MRPLGIVHVLEKNRLATGSVCQMLDAATGLAAREHRVTVVSRPGGDLEAACREAPVGFVGLPLRRALDLSSARGLRRVVRLTGADVVHVHKGRAHGIALLATVGLGPLPVVVVNRGVSFPLDGFNRWKYRHPRVGAVVCVADAVRSTVIATGRLDPAAVHTIYAGTDPHRFDPRRVDRLAARRELGLGPEALVVGQVSLRPWKGWRAVLDAFADLAPARPRAELVLVGGESGEHVREAEAAATELGVGDRVRVLGVRRDMPEVLAACDVVVDASSAGTGITGTIREAMCLGRAVVATDCGGNAELVSGNTGLLVPRDDPAALVQAVGRLLDDDVLRIRLGQAARRRVLASFTSEHRLDRLEGLYAGLVRRRDQPGGIG